MSVLVPAFALLITAAVRAQGRFLFVPNHGQEAPSVRFITRGPHLEGRFDDCGFELVLAGPGSNASESAPGDEPVRVGTAEPIARKVAYLLFTIEATGPAHRLVGRDALGATISTYRGADPSRWREDIPTYDTVAYPDIRPGLDLEIGGEAGRLRPCLRADARMLSTRDLAARGGSTFIRFHVAGAGSLAIDPNRGDLIVETGARPVRLAAPRGTLEAQGAPDTTVPCRYRVVDADHVDILFGGSDAGPTSAGHESAPAAVARPPISDQGGGSGPVSPGPVWATYLGGSADDEAAAVTLDDQGNIFVIGWTESPDFPTSTDAYDGSFAGAEDVFIAKLDPTGTRLIYATYLGGREIDRGTAATLLEDGSLLVAGWTSSDDFPVTPGAYDRSFGGGSDWKSDGFVARLDAKGGRLLLGSYIGGSSDDRVYAVARGSQGELALAGTTYSPDFPVTPDAVQGRAGAGGDAFFLELTPNGQSLLYSTYLGGIELDEATGLHIRPTGETWLTGRTFSVDFPVSYGAFDETYNGSYDIFVTKLDAANTAIVYSTLIGGIRRDEAWASALGEDETVYLTGVTRSPDFPVTPDAYDTGENGHYDAIVVALDPSGSRLVYSTYLGGEDIDYTRGIAVGSDGSAVVSGRTWSSLFPVTPGAQDVSFNGGIDAFVARLDPTGGELSYATFLGGHSEDYANGLTLDETGAVHAVGVARDGFPVSPDAYDPSWNGGRDAFVASFRPVSSCPADWSTFGSGWPGTRGIPSLNCLADPVLCRTLYIQVANTPKSKTIGTALVGFSRAPSSPAKRRLIEIIPWSTFAVRLQKDTTVLDINLPCDNDLCGQTIYLQILFPDPGAFGGVAATPGLRLSLGG